MLTFGELSISPNSKENFKIQENFKDCTINVNTVNPSFLLKHKISGFTLDITKCQLISIQQRVGYQIIAGPFPGRRLGTILSFAPVQPCKDVKVTITKNKPQFEKEDLHFIEFYLTVNGKSYNNQISLLLNYTLDNLLYQFSLGFILSKDFLFLDENGNTQTVKFENPNKKKTIKNTELFGTKRKHELSLELKEQSRLLSSTIVPLKKVKHETGFPLSQLLDTSENKSDHFSLWDK